MKTKENINWDLTGDTQPGQSFLGDLDPDKLFLVLKKSKWLLLLIFLLTNLIAYLAIRYTKPVFESYSDLKLEIKNDASVLGLIESSETQNLNSLSGEIELLKSKLFFNQVIKVLDLQVSYYSLGNFLIDERYNRSPVSISYKLKNNAGYDRDFKINILNRETFRLSYEWDKQQITSEHRFGELVDSELLDFQADLLQPYDRLNDNTVYSFVINSDQKLLNYLQRNLVVEPLNLNANTIRVSFRDHNPYKARDLVNAIDSIYLKYSKQEKNKANKQKIDFLDQQLQLTQKQLTDYEDYFEDFTITNKTTNVENDINNIIKAINSVDSQKIALQKQQAELSILQEQGLAALKVGQSYNLEIDEGLKKLSLLMDEKELILGSYNENTFAVQKKQQEVDLAQKGLMEQIDHYQKSIAQQSLLLNSQKITLENNLKKLPSKGTEYSSNARNFSLYEEFLLTLMQLKADFEIAQAGTTNDFVILSAATFPNKPIAPDKLIIHGIGVVAGLFIGIFLIGFRYAFHNKINSHQELEKLTRTPILGTVPFYDKEKMKESKLVIDKYPKSPVSESLRTIRTNMEFLKVTKGKKVISVTSTVSGEGKTFLAVNLGGIISLSQQKVVIIDMDMRRPKIHKAFNGQDNLKGLSTILINKHHFKECIQESSLEGLDFIPAGPTPPNPSELLLGKEVDMLFEELKQTYDVIILDTPPVGLVTDGILAMKKADLPIYVVRCDYSKRDFIKSLNRLVKTDQFKNLSVILNSLNLSSGRGYGYGYGYGYGKGYYE